MDAADEAHQHSAAPNRKLIETLLQALGQICIPKHLADRRRIEEVLEQLVWPSTFAARLAPQGQRRCPNVERLDHRSLIHPLDLGAGLCQLA